MLENPRIISQRFRSLTHYYFLVPALSPVPPSQRMIPSIAKPQSRLLFTSSSSLLAGSRTESPGAAIDREDMSRPRPVPSSDSADKSKPKSKPKVTDPRPSASIILISPRNSVLLLHRVQTSSSFPSAHVFPGGNISATDGPISTNPNDPARHVDSPTYRRAAIRELFEESGILLARTTPASPSLLSVSASNRQAGRKAIHSRQIQFSKWLSQLPTTIPTDGSATSSPQSAPPVLDLASLHPFTHWVTPPQVPKRFTTQMYLYFVPVSEDGNESIVPVSDDIETTSADWAPAAVWLERARKGEIILFPPQFLLLSLVSLHLDGKNGGGAKEEGVVVEGSVGEDEILRRRAALLEFVNGDGDPPWRDKYISPVTVKLPKPRVGKWDRRGALALDYAGPELEGSGFRGDGERVVLLRAAKEGPRDLEVVWKRDLFGDEGGKVGNRGGSHNEKKADRSRL